MNKNNNATVALIVAGGTSSRYGATLPAGVAPKPFAPLLGQSVLAHSAHRMAEHTGIDHVYIAIRAEHRSLCDRQLANHPKISVLETAGDTRQATVRQSLQMIATATTNAPAHVIIHDAARPCWSIPLLDKLIEEGRHGHAAVCPALPLTDTLRRIESVQGTTTAQAVDRHGMHAIQTPQLFNFAQLLDLHQRHAGTDATDDSALFENAGLAVHYIAGEKWNIKITHAGDLDEAAALLSMSRGDIRTATGYDVHEYIDATPERPLRLGGITIAHDKALKGHSDADAVLHAITDALLGCIAAEDIGFHFSPKDARWKDADSTLFLAHARDMITAQGGLIMHIDATIICEEPKIGPHRASMQDAIAGILAIAPSRVSIKATTSEGLGFTGRREGLAAQACATVRLPFSFSSSSESLTHAA